MAVGLKMPGRKTTWSAHREHQEKENNNPCHVAISIMLEISCLKEYTYANASDPQSAPPSMVKLGSPSALVMTNPPLPAL